MASAPASASACLTSAAITPADSSACPGRMAERPPTASASSHPVSSATMTRVFEPPPSTPTRMSVIRVLCARTVSERRNDSDGHCYQYSNQHVPWICNFADIREWGGHRWKNGDELFGEDDDRHNDQRDTHSGNC